MGWVPWLLGLALLFSSGTALALAPAPVHPLVPPIAPPPPQPPLPPLPVNPGFRPDLTVSISGPAEFVAGQPFTDLVTVTVANRGTESSGRGFMVDLKLRPDTGTRVLASLLSQFPIEEPLNGNESRTFTPMGTIPEDIADGTYCLWAEVDPDEEVVESNEGNNTYCHLVTITGGPGDLSVTLSAPDTLFQGQHLDGLASVIVRHHGADDSLPNLAVNAYTIEVVLAEADYTPFSRGEGELGDRLLLFRMTSTAGLAAGSERKHPIDAAIPADTPIGAYCLLAFVDPDDTIPEANEFNNYYCQQITIAAPVPPANPPATPPTGPPVAPPEVPPTLLPADPPPPTFPAVCATQQFSDLPITHRACAAVSVLVSKGIVNGFPDGTFRPDQTVTRAEFAKMFVLTTGLAPMPANPLPFSDAEGHWAAVQGFLGTAAASAAIVGFPDGTFRPDDLVTRTQGVKIVTADLLPNPLVIPAAMPTDIGVDAWYGPYVATGIAQSLMGAISHYPLFTEATFQGDTPMTRTEAALLLANLLVVSEQ